jgi:hypothetical protein
VGFDNLYLMTYFDTVHMYMSYNIVHIHLPYVKIYTMSLNANNQSSQNRFHDMYICSMSKKVIHNMSLNTNHQNPQIHIEIHIHLTYVKIWHIQSNVYVSKSEFVCFDEWFVFNDMLYILT